MPEKHLVVGTSKNWRSVGTRIPPNDLKRFDERYPDKGQKAKVLRCLLQMHLDNKIPKLEFTYTETL